MSSSSSRRNDNGVCLVLFGREVAGRRNNDDRIRGVGVECSCQAFQRRPWPLFDGYGGWWSAFEWAAALADGSMKSSVVCIISGAAGEVRKRGEIWRCNVKSVVV